MPPTSPDDRRRRAQGELIHRWLASDDAHLTASRLLRRRGLNDDPHDLLHDAWVRISRSFDADRPLLETMDDSRDAARYGARVLDNLARDRVRSRSRRKEVTLNPADLDIRAAAVGNDHESHERVLVEQLLNQVALLVGDMPRCRGCSNDVVAATALTLLHMVLNDEPGAERGRRWIDQMLNAALERADPQIPTSQSAREQRKSRCGRCVIALITAAMTALEGRSS